MPDTALVEAIRATLSGNPFHGEGHRKIRGHRKIWARLRMAGVRTSTRRVLRLMREHGLLAPSRAGSPRGPRNHDGTIIHPGRHPRPASPTGWTKCGALI
jgi:putative transposase